MVNRIETTPGSNGRATHARIYMRTQERANNSERLGWIWVETCVRTHTHRCVIHEIIYTLVYVYAYRKKWKKKTRNEKRKGRLIQLRYIEDTSFFVKIIKYVVSSFLPFFLLLRVFILLFIVCYNKKPFFILIINPAGKTASVFWVRVRDTMSWRYTHKTQLTRKCSVHILNDRHH